MGRMQPEQRPDRQTDPDKPRRREIVAVVLAGSFPNGQPLESVLDYLEQTT